MTPPTDIVILVRLTRQFPAEEHFKICMETLKQHTRNFRVILVDDDSDPYGQKLIEDVAELMPESIMIRTHKQHWFTRAANLGLSMVKTKYAVLLNCDTIMGENWLEELYEVAVEVERSHGFVGLVGSVYAQNEPRRYSVCSHPGYVTGHCWLCNMEAFKQISPCNMYLDETNPLNIHIRSDVDMCYRLMAKNWMCVSAYKSAVGHEAGKTWGHMLGLIPNTLDAVNYKY
jgi:glycosyltransferase involved in cell wall biosynthesis